MHLLISKSFWNKSIVKHVIFNASMLGLTSTFKKLFAESNVQVYSNPIHSDRGREKVLKELNGNIKDLGINWLLQHSMYTYKIYSNLFNFHINFNKYSLRKEYSDFETAQLGSITLHVLHFTFNTIFNFIKQKNNNPFNP